jgi:hypothetical protein
VKHLGFRRPFPGTLRLACVLVALLLWPLQPVPLVAGDEPYTIEDFVVDVVELDDGRTIVGFSTPLPPPDVSGLSAAAAVEEIEASAVQLSGVPAFDWCYGCSATAAAMLFGYYDRVGWDNMYAGPANGGVCPLTNATWGSGESPLSATHQGIDGLADRGHVDDYYVGGSGSSDPYYDNWTEHEYADCTADFMGTSQFYNWDNVDGSTRFYFYSNNEPLYDFSGYEGGSTPRRDGTHGMWLFAESRGYAVVLNYNQYIYGFGGINDGFTFGQYCDEIDAGRPVLIQVAGHTMLGVGYDEPSTVLLHDTWNHDVHTMTWGGSYAGLTHYGVSVIELEAPATAPAVSTEPATNVEETAVTLQGSVDDDGGDTCEYRFRYGTASGVYDVDTSWTGSVVTGDGFSEDVSGLDEGRTYYFVAQARNNGGISSGGEEQFTTKPEAPSGLVATAAGTDSIDLSWVAGAGADATRIQRGEDSYPADRNVGVTVYDGSGESASDSGLKPGTLYYYRAWSHHEGSDQWSDGFSEATAQTGLVLVVAGSLGLVPDGTGSTAVTFTGAVDLAAATIVLSFDPAVAELTAVASGDLGSVSSNGIPDANATGQLTMSWFDVVGHSGDYTFAALTFHAVGAAPSETLLDLSVSTFIDSLGQPIACEDSDGTLTVLNLMEGDVTLDLHTNIVDAMFVAQYTVGLRQFDAAQLLCGDTNDDGHVDIVDAMHIAQYTVDHDSSGGVLFQPLWREAYDAGLLPPA